MLKAKIENTRSAMMIFTDSVISRSGAFWVFGFRKAKVHAENKAQLPFHWNKRTE